jgi:hypothetical protein
MSLSVFEKSAVGSGGLAVSRFGMPVGARLSVIAGGGLIVRRTVYSFVMGTQCETEIIEGRYTTAKEVNLI